MGSSLKVWTGSSNIAARILYLQLKVREAQTSCIKIKGSVWHGMVW